MKSISLESSTSLTPLPLIFDRSLEILGIPACVEFWMERGGPRSNKLQLPRFLRNHHAKERKGKLREERRGKEGGRNEPMMR